MDQQTAWMLALQLVALISIAGAILLYLVCKIRGGSDPACTESGPGAGKAVLVTCCDNAMGLQIAIHLANLGFRVFAGLKPGPESESSASAQVIRAWQKHRETVQKHGNIVALPLDVTREDLLYESVDIIRAHLPAGEDGIWAVICTNGSTYRNPLTQQNIDHWDSLLKINVIGVLRTARTFQNLLKNSRGRILTIGTTDNMGSGLVVYAASRFAVEGASYALKHELSPFGIKVVTLNPMGIMPELLFCQPKISKKIDADKVCVEINGGVEFQPHVLSARALEIVDQALTIKEPRNSYKLEYKYNKWMYPLQIFKRI
ncbi:D-beta-hydroxybutyrate dehydrogenase, mitochondrial [Anthonomus grandis grandis]|uniref:D-beta-hydroxybutyrate dehydrogenase, mitochondrial n=1 Tax=Anthonomus grandis grandis TaxID=2921223 RepID=UPI002166189B|nr:D-beta-hydroxybutyrate dehydrogenase, mitochondrial [Anthonomus grandis grandis]